MSYKNNKEKLVNEFANVVANKINSNKERMEKIKEELEKEFDSTLFKEVFELKGFNDGLEYGIELLNEFNQKVYSYVLDKTVDAIFNGEVEQWLNSL